MPEAQGREAYYTGMYEAFACVRPSDCSWVKARFRARADISGQKVCRPHGGLECNRILPPPPLGVATDTRWQGDFGQVVSV